MFRNEPLIDFTIAEFRSQFEKMLDLVEVEIKAKKFNAFPIIDGKEIRCKLLENSLDPSNPDVIVGVVNFADESQLKSVIDSLKSGQAQWRSTTISERARTIKHAGQLMRERREKLAALIVREAGKPWIEADADVCEAIDFCDYYAEEHLVHGKPRSMSLVPGETNIYHYQPRGIALVIAPWNFPLAIACGMTVAALVTGNCTVLKPSEQTSLIAYEFAKILLEAGVPKNAFAFLPGKGEVVGRGLVNAPEVDLICFTGSKAVGLEILSSAARVLPGQKGIKKVIAELGGKNAIIVDEDADLDEAIKGVIYSAFGYAGQKCSACSRVVVVGDAYETFINRLRDAAADIIVGEAKDSSTLLGPVIDGQCQKRILEIIARAEIENKLVFKGQTPSKGYFAPITILRDVAQSSEIWREEIFGPVLGIAKAENFDQAIKMVNDSQYALTGGLFSRSPDNIEKARQQLEVGNLYINRGCTGAMVCRQPFGGFKMSGVGSKAGGPDYLIQFMEPRSITENTMRRGFAPEQVAV